MAHEANVSSKTQAEELYSAISSAIPDHAESILRSIEIRMGRGRLQEAEEEMKAAQVSGLVASA